MRLRRNMLQGLMNTGFSLLKNLKRFLKKYSKEMKNKPNHYRITTGEV